MGNTKQLLISDFLRNNNGMIADVDKTPIIIIGSITFYSPYISAFRLGIPCRKIVLER